MFASLLHANRDPEPPIPQGVGTKQRKGTLEDVFTPTRRAPSSKFIGGDTGPTATLVVAPVSLLSQWRDEIVRSSAKGSVQVSLWHGQTRGVAPFGVGINVIITSYGTLAAEHAKTLKTGGSSVLYDGVLPFGP
jgi:DNA repair protein RAD5